MNTKLIIVALAAFTVGGACPSDVNNDGTVGIQDFLQLLGDWGPCPAPVLIDVATTPNTQFGACTITVRQWSDGFAEYRLENFGACTSAQPEWTPVPDSPVPPLSLVVALDAGGNYTDSNNFGLTQCDRGNLQGGAFFVRLYADGTTETIKAKSCVESGGGGYHIEWLDWEQQP